MDKIDVIVTQTPDDPGFMNFLARLTQRGHKLQTAQDVVDLINKDTGCNTQMLAKLAQSDHGELKRCLTYGVVVVGASRRFLAQMRTHAHCDFVSASLQYSDYTDSGTFVTPYNLIANPIAESEYLDGCRYAMNSYKRLAEMDGVDNDDAGYAAPQGLRNILWIQANLQQWQYLFQLRACKRNSVEMQYVMLLIHKAFMETLWGEQLFGHCGPKCYKGRCNEGDMTCGVPVIHGPATRLEREFPLCDIL